MIVKFFGNKGGGSAKASIDYLRGKDKEREGARVIKGDPDLSQAIAESLEFKNNYTVGCLSFEEKNIPEEHKKEIIEKFEATIFAGLEKDQYNISWIEHTDKDRLELNFFIPNVELTTQKRLQPYYDKADRPLIDNFKKVTNYEYGLSNPDLDDKKQLVKNDLTTPRPVKELKEEITTLFSEKISEGVITSREQIKEELEKIGLEITRTTANSISIKNPDPEAKRNIRLDGEIYKESFYEEVRAITEFKEQFRSDSEDNSGRSRERKGNCEGISKEDHERNFSNLQRGIEQRTERNEKIYKKQNDLEHRNDQFSFDLSYSNRRADSLLNDSKERDRSITESEIDNDRVTTIYSARSSKDERRQRVEHNLSLQRQKEERILRSKTSERLKNQRINEVLKNVSERIKGFIERTRGGASRLRGLFGEFKERINEIETDIRETDRTAKERIIRSTERKSNSIEISRRFRDSYQKIGEREQTITTIDSQIESRKSIAVRERERVPASIVEDTRSFKAVKEPVKQEKDIELDFDR